MKERMEQEEEKSDGIKHRTKECHGEQTNKPTNKQARHQRRISRREKRKLRLFSPFFLYFFKQIKPKNKETQNRREKPVSRVVEKYGWN